MTERGPAIWQGLAIPIAADRVVIDRRAAAVLVHVIDRYCRVERITLPPALRQMRNVLELVAQANEDRERRQPAEATSWASDEIGTEEAARILGGCSARHVRRLAVAGALGPTRVVAKRRLISRAEVEAYRRAQVASQPHNTASAG